MKMKIKFAFVVIMLLAAKFSFAQIKHSKSTIYPTYHSLIMAGIKAGFEQKGRVLMIRPMLMVYLVIHESMFGRI